MVGYGVSPVFETQGLTDSSDLNGDGRIDIGDVLKNSNVELPFKLTNNSPFEVTSQPPANPHTPTSLPPQRGGPYRRTNLWPTRATRPISRPPTVLTQRF